MFYKITARYMQVDGTLSEWFDLPDVYYSVHDRDRRLESLNRASRRGKRGDEYKALDVDEGAEK